MQLHSYTVAHRMALATTGINPVKMMLLLQAVMRPSRLISQCSEKSISQTGLTLRPFEGFQGFLAIHHRGDGLARGSRITAKSPIASILHRRLGIYRGESCIA